MEEKFIKAERNEKNNLKQPAKRLAYTNKYDSRDARAHETQYIYKKGPCYSFMKLIN